MHENSERPYYPFVTDLAALRIKSREVDPEDRENLKLAERMADLMVGRGVGLAAIQLGVARQVIVVNPGMRVLHLAHQHYMMANPQLLAASEETDWQKEGCLSLLDPATDPPDPVFVRVERPVKVAVRFYDLKARQWREIETDNPYTARIIQHEMDHLQGKLITDYLPQDEEQLRAVG